MEFYQRYEVLVSMIMFALGFLVDVYTIRRIDSLFGLIQQGIYLTVLGTFLILEIRIVNGSLKLSPKKEKFWQYHNLVVHFLFGALLSLYTIFYYTSASAITSFIYILLLAGLMLANEFGKIRSVGLPVRITLYSICTLSYFSFFYPILMGKIGVVPFWLGFLSSLFLVTLVLLFNFRGKLRKQLLIPALGVHLFFVVAYYTALIPPVPVAIKRIGVYHGVQKQAGKYIGFHQRTFWDSWYPGKSREFIAREGDKVFVLMSIFSPTRFQDQVFLKWYYYSDSGWGLEDTIPLNIIGGRSEGFRGFASKQFYKLGTWRIIVETSDGREVGRINLKIKADESKEERFFEIDRY